MTIDLVTNPAADARFRSRAQALLADGAKTPEGLRRKLSDEYPNVAVSDGIVEYGVQRWYAYRDGHWIRAVAADQAGGRSRG